MEMIKDRKDFKLKQGTVKSEPGAKDGKNRATNGRHKRLNTESYKLKQRLNLKKEKPDRV